MRKFVINSLLFLCLFVLLDVTLGAYLVNLVPKKEIDKRIALLEEGKINASTLIMGSSRAAHNIDAYLLEKETQETCFNLGYRGSNLAFHTFLLEQYLHQNKAPKRIIYVADVPFMFDATALQFRNDVLSPFVAHPEINKKLIENNQLSKLAYVLNLPKVSFKSLTDKVTKSIDNAVDLKGSTLLEVETYKGNGANFVANKKPTKSADLLKIFTEIQQLCNKKGIAFIVAIPPNNEKLDANFVSFLKKQCQTETLFFQYNANYSLPDHSNFYDISHLNKKGATIFTKEVANFVKSNH